MDGGAGFLFALHLQGMYGTRHQTPDQRGQKCRPNWAKAARPHAFARCWSELFPVFPFDLALFPVRPGTEMPN